MNLIHLSEKMVDVGYSYDGQWNFESNIKAGNYQIIYYYFPSVSSFPWIATGNNNIKIRIYNGYATHPDSWPDLITNFDCTTVVTLDVFNVYTNPTTIASTWRDTIQTKFYTEFGPVSESNVLSDDMIQSIQCNYNADSNSFEIFGQITFPNPLAGTLGCDIDILWNDDQSTITPILGKYGYKTETASLSNINNIYHILIPLNKTNINNFDPKFIYAEIQQATGSLADSNTSYGNCIIAFDDFISGQIITFPEDFNRMNISFYRPQNPGSALPFSNDWHIVLQRTI